MSLGGKRVGRLGAASLLMLVVVMGDRTVAQTPLESVYNSVDEPFLRRVVGEYEPLVKTTSAAFSANKVLGIAYHNLGTMKISGAPLKAVSHLDTARQQAPADAEVLAYLGSAITMVARDSWNPFTKVREVNRGTALVDKAVGMEPNDIAVRMVRAINSMSVPAFLNRFQFAKTDLTHLLALAASPVANVSFTPDILARIHLSLGDVYRHDAQEAVAMEHWRRVLEIAPASHWATEARDRLRDKR